MWTPAWGTSNQGAAEDETEFNRDPRERVWYFDDTAFASAMGAWVPGSTPVYDVIHVYAAGTPWDAATGTPGMPAWLDRGGFTVADLQVEATAELPACTSVVTPP
ncbi:MAG: hypothetical protein KDA24_25195 [Deltaproteobacteria bacterium]|nr:hypothetical protein [Deltaproteobacteria bacterium]